MERKRGVSLIVLVVTVIVLSILVTITVLGSIKSVNRSKINQLEAELIQLQDLVVLSKEIGNTEDYLLETPLTRTQFKTLVGSGGAQLEEEFTLNGESTASTFTKLNVSKISDNEFAKGQGRKGNADYYFVSSVTGKIYYATGLKVGGKSYFSLTKKISKNSSYVSGEAINTEIVTVTSESDSNAFFTEEIKDGKVFVKLRGINWNAPTAIGKGIIQMSITYNGVNYTDNIAYMEPSETQNYRQIRPNGKITAKMLTEATTVKLTRNDGTWSSYVQALSPEAVKALDVLAPTIAGVKLIEKSSKNIVQVSAEDSKSGIAGIYLLETQKKDANGRVVDIFETDYEEEKLVDIILQKGKRADGLMVEVDKTFVDGYVVAVDNAGNTSAVQLVSKGVTLPEPHIPVEGILTPVKYSHTNEEITTNKEDPNWYDYEKGKWANAKNTNGDMFVWIPRFAYKITYYDAKVTNNTPNGNIVGYSDARGYVDAAGKPSTTFSRLNPVIDVVFLGAGANKYRYIKDGFFYGDTSSADPTVNPEYYIVHPAFTTARRTGYGNSATDTAATYGMEKEITGFWVAKFNASATLNTSNTGFKNIEVKPGKSAAINLVRAAIPINKASKWLESGVEDSPNKILFPGNNRFKLKPMVLSNAQYGAIAYLTVAKGKVPTDFSQTSTITGEGYPISGYSKSTTGNSTGVWDLTNSLTSHTAAYVNTNHQNIADHCAAYNGNRKTALADYYDQSSSKTASANFEANKRIYGDALYEVMQVSGTSILAADGSSVVYPSGMNPIFTRGNKGLYGVKAEAGNDYPKHSLRLTFVPATPDAD